MIRFLPCLLALAVVAGPGLHLAAQEGRGREAGPAAYGWQTSYRQAREVARQTGKPLMVVFRCVPWGDCREFDEQVVRLEEIKQLADQFVRVRLTEIEQADLGLFDFDYDLTIAVFFLNADEQIYGRYGGRDAAGPDARQSLAGLKVAMQAALETHRQHPEQAVARGEEKFLSEFPAARNRRGCIHCHQVNEIVREEMEKQGSWSRELVFRYPLPDNLGLVLDVDRGNVVERVVAESAAEQAGLQAGDVVQRINELPVHSLADAQFALDRAPAEGAVTIAWQRAGESCQGQLTLARGWRRSDISWRPSLMDMQASARLYGEDLSHSEKRQLGLEPQQLAFRQSGTLHEQARAAGIQTGDVILGFDGKRLELDAYDFLHYVRSNYVVGDRVQVDLIRGGKRMQLPMTLRPFL